MTAPLFELEGVRVVRGDRVVLDDVSLRVDAGEHTVILGPNGSGKSTLVSILTLDAYPVARPGTRVAIEGRERWNVFDLRRAIGIVSTDLARQHAQPWVTVEDVAVSAFFASVGVWMADEPTREMRERARAALDRAGIAHLAARRMTELSPGEARRALVARALVHEPRALVLDEPSNALDPGARHALRAVVSELAAGGVTVVLVTHDLADVGPEIRRAVLLARGRVVADGAVDDVVTSARLSALFGAELEVARAGGRLALV